MKLTIGCLYPDLLNLYGDRGNMRCLVKRLEWRGIGAAEAPVMAGERVDFNEMDIVILGGGSDREEELAGRYLREQREAVREYVENGGVMLAVCGGYQLLGEYYETNDRLVEGLGILDVRTRWEPRRLVHNIVLESPLAGEPVVGFENHGGRTDIGGHKPFGRVVCGYGNTETSGYEGVVYKNVIATYLHGPLLPKNPQVCDYLLGKALRRRFGESVRLGSLPDELEHRANGSMVKRCRSRRFWL